MFEAKAKINDGCIWIVVAENLPEVGAFFRHGRSSRLAKPDAVSLADSFKNNVVAFLSHSEVIAGSGTPAQLMEEKANGPAHKPAIRASAAILIWTIRR